LPSRRIEPIRITKSCTAPASTTPITIQSVPGDSELGRQHRPISGPRRRWREVMAESTHRPVGLKSRPLSSRFRRPWPAIIQPKSARPGKRL